MTTCIRCASSSLHALLFWLPSPCWLCLHVPNGTHQVQYQEASRSSSTASSSSSSASASSSEEAGTSSLMKVAATLREHISATKIRRVTIEQNIASHLTKVSCVSASSPLSTLAPVHSPVTVHIAFMWFCVIDTVPAREQCAQCYSDSFCCPHTKFKGSFIVRWFAGSRSGPSWNADVRDCEIRFRPRMWTNHC